MTLVKLWAACLLLAYAAGACQAGYTVQEQRLGPVTVPTLDGAVPSGNGLHLAWHSQGRLVVDGVPGLQCDRGYYQVSDDGQHGLGTATIGRKHMVITDGVFGPPFDEVSAPHCWQGKRVAYRARQGDKWSVVLDGHAGLGYEWVSYPYFTSEGHVVYAAQTGGKCRVVTYRMPSPEFDEIRRSDYEEEPELVFSDQGQRLAYVGKLGKRETAVVDGVPGPLYDEILEGTPVFSSDSAHVAYAGRQGGRWTVVVDGVPGPQYDAIHAGGLGLDPPLVFSPDGKHLAYEARDKDQRFAVLDGAREPVFEFFGSPVYFSPDSKRLAYVAMAGQRKWTAADGPKPRDWEGGDFIPQSSVVVNGLPGPLYDGIDYGRPFFVGPGGQQVAYVVQRHQKEFVVIDGVPGPEYDNLGGAALVVGPGAGRVAYLGQTGHKQVVVVDGKPSREYDEVYHLAFSPDGKRFAYEARKDHKWLFVLDGVAGPPSDFGGGSPPVFSPDGKHVAYTAYSTGPPNCAAMVEDGVVGPRYDMLDMYGRGPIFHQDGSLEYLAVRDGVLYRVKHVPTADN